MLDIFRTDAFSVTALTDAILKAPYKPGRIGQLGLFAERGITTTSVVVEEKNGRLSLIPTSPRGGKGPTMSENKRTARSFLVPHLEKEGSVLADQVQNVRAFGSEDQTAAVQQLVDQQLGDLRAEHEVTLEHMRIGAIKGAILDSDGSTLLDLFTGFAVSQSTAELDLAADVRSQLVAIARQVEGVLGGDMYQRLHAFVGDSFFDLLVDAEDVKESLKYQESAVLRGDLRSGFLYGGITFENYRGATGGTPFVAADKAYVFPVGTNIFKTYFAPADFLETVNTLGLPVYAKQAVMEFDRGVKILTQSNPLCLNLRPDAVVEVTLAT